MPQASCCISCSALLNFALEVLLAQVHLFTRLFCVSVYGDIWSGKTLLARTLANVIDIPFSINDATSFTQVLHFATKGINNS